MSDLIRSVSVQHMKYQFKLFLQKLHNKLLVLQPEIYITSNLTEDAVQLQVVWKSSSRNKYVTYNTYTTYNSDYLAAIDQMCMVCTYALGDAQVLADSPFLDVFFGMQPLQQKIENSPLQSLLKNVN